MRDRCTGHPAAADLLRSALDINAAGQITGRLIDHTTGRFVTYVATPLIQ